MSKEAFEQIKEKSVKKIINEQNFNDGITCAELAFSEGWHSAIQLENRALNIAIHALNIVLEELATKNDCEFLIKNTIAALNTIDSLRRIR